MPKKLEGNMGSRKIGNYLPIQGVAVDSKLPERTFDLVLMVDVHHEFSHPAEMLEALVKALKPDGRLVFVEYRAEDPNVPIKRLHKMSEKQVIKEAEANGPEHVETIGTLPRQHTIVFRGPPPLASGRP